MQILRSFELVIVHLIVLASSLSKINTKPQFVYTFLKPIPTKAGLEDIVTEPSYVVGSRQLRRSVDKRRYFKNTALEKAKLSHASLNALISELVESPSAAYNSMQIKKLKTEKLRLKDMIASLSAELELQQNATITASASPSLLGMGGFGRVLFGHCVNTSKEIAIKISTVNESKSLFKEYLVLERMKSKPGFPRAHYFGKQKVMDFKGGDHVVLVMDVLGPSLDRLLFSSTLGVRGFSPQTVLRIAMQLLTRLEDLADFGIVHGDVQPGNFLMGKGSDKDKNTVHLIDFGLARLPAAISTKADGSGKPFRGALDSFSPTSTSPTSSSPPTLPFSSISSSLADVINGSSTCNPGILAGTVSFSSIGVSKGLSATFKDDLESLCYCLSYFLRGWLPWSKLVDSSPITSSLTMNNQSINTLSVIEDVTRLKESLSLLSNYSARNLLFGDDLDLHMHMQDNVNNDDLNVALRDTPAAQAIYAMFAHAHSLCRHEYGSDKPDFCALKDIVKNALQQLPPEEANDEEYCWVKEGIRWSDLDGTLIHELY